MREGWEVKTLGEVCDLQNGFAFKSKSYVEFSNVLNIRMSNIRPDGTFNPEHNIRYLPNNFKDEYKQYILKKDDLIIAMTDMAGDPKILGLPTLVNQLHGRIFLLNQRVGKLKNFSPDIFIPYLRYYLSSPIIKDYYKSKGAGGLQLNISKKDILTAEIPIPPLQEQTQIVKTLDIAFKQIDQAKANLEQNLHNAKELFASKLNEIFSQRGEGWEEKPIKDLTTLVTKGSSPNWQGVEYVNEGGIFFLTSKNVGEGKLLLDNKKYLEEKFNEIQKSSILKKGDVLSNIVGASIGRTSIFNLDETTNINQAVCLMRCIPEEIYNYYLMHLLNSPFFKNILHNNEVDNARANLSLTFFKNLVIPLPKLKKQIEIVNKIKELSKESNNLQTHYQQKLNNLEELKKSILQKAFRGEL